MIEEIVDASDTLDRYRIRLDSECACRSSLASGSSVDQQFDSVPGDFLKALVKNYSPPKAGCKDSLRSGAAPKCADPKATAIDQPNKILGLARGGADVYATAPVELAQQISTTLSAFRSFEMALSLAAALPTQGLGANVGFNRLSAARSDLEARERLPQVVGFAERTVGLTHGGREVEDPQFGWVFGPQASIDAQGNRLRLRRPVVNLPVTADLSIPGWWPKVDLKLETAWVANWHQGRILREKDNEAKNVEATEFPVYLPLNRADLDGLTEYLAKKTVGGALAYTSISAVTPEKISTCADEVTFLVHGANLWRSSDAFLNGLKASDIRVLPDMGGLAVTFKGIRNGLPQVPKANGEATLTVWTRNGASSRKVTVLDPKAAGLSCGPAKEQSLKLAVGPRPLIPADASPTEKTAKEVRLQVKQGKLPTAYAELKISVRPVKPLADGVMSNWSELAEDNVSRDGDFLEGDVKWSFKANPGDAIQVSLVEVPVEGAEGKHHAVEGPLVYYPTQEEAQIRVVTSAPILTLNQEVELRFPYRYDLAFPHLKEGKAKWELKTGSPLPKGYKITPIMGKFPDAKQEDAAGRTLKLKVQVQKDDEDLNETDLQTFLATGRKVTVILEIASAPRWAWPKVMGTFTLGKATAGS